MGVAATLPELSECTTQAIVMSRFNRPKGGCSILIKDGIRKFVVSTVVIVCKPFSEQRATEKANKLKNSAWFLT